MVCVIIGMYCQHLSQKVTSVYLMNYDWGEELIKVFSNNTFLF